MFTSPGLSVRKLIGCMVWLIDCSFAVSDLLVNLAMCLLGSLSRGLARLSAVQDTKVVRARSVLTQCDPATTPSSALSPVNLPASETPPKFGRSMSTSSLLVPGNFIDSLLPHYYLCQRWLEEAM